VLSLRPRFAREPAHSLAFWVPFVFHTYCLAAGLLSSALFDPPILLLVSVAMLALSLWLHRHSLRGLLGRRSAAPAEMY
jgi:hypothetical protein